MGLFRSNKTNVTTQTTVDNTINIENATTNDVDVALELKPSITNTIDLSGLAGPLDKMAASVMATGEANAKAMMDAAETTAAKLAAGIQGAAKTATDGASAIASDVTSGLQSIGNIAGAIVAIVALYFLFFGKGSTALEFDR